MDDAAYQNPHDVSNEQAYFAMPGLQHKYRETALLIVSLDCEETCPWCFRKRLFGGAALPNDRVVQPDKAIRYLSEHTEVRSVLMTGGDAMLANPDLIRTLCDGVASIPHVHNVRFGTCALVLDPTRFAPRLPREVPGKRIYVPLHIVRPGQVTQELQETVAAFPNHRFVTQTPLLRGVNDNPDLLAELWHEAVAAGIQPYYCFQCRPAAGNQRFALTLAQGHRLFATAQSRCTGVVKTARYVMSNQTGKWEIVGLDGDQAILRCYQCIHPHLVGSLQRVPAEEAWWDLQD